MTAYLISLALAGLVAIVIWFGRPAHECRHHSVHPAPEASSRVDGFSYDRVSLGGAQRACRRRSSQT
jgi:hypothetical protein